MMTDVSQYMNAVAASIRLQHQIDEFESAVAARDPGRISAADLSLRSAALVLIGTVAVGSAEASQSVNLLQNVVNALRRAAADLAREAEGPRASLGQRVYMRLGSEEIKTP